MSEKTNKGSTTSENGTPWPPILDRLGFKIDGYGAVE